MSTRFVVFDADWQEPPGTVVKVFSSREAAEAYRDGPGDGYGYSVVEVPDPEDAMDERVEDTAHTFQIAHDAVKAIELGAGSEHYRYGRETMQADALAQIDLFSSHIRQP